MKKSRYQYIDGFYLIFFDIQSTWYIDASLAEAASQRTPCPSRGTTETIVYPDVTLALLLTFSTKFRHNTLDIL